MGPSAVTMDGKGCDCLEKTLLPLMMPMTKSMLEQIEPLDQSLAEPCMHGESGS
jgi:hypothetical protein